MMLLRRIMLAALPVLATLTMIGHQDAQAASAVVIDPNRNTYYWHAAELEAQAVDGAVNDCEASGAKSCVVFSVCGLPGAGAVAFNKATGNWGASCGGKVREQADSLAIETCELRSQSKGGCEVVERFDDSFPGTAVARGYFAGQWAEDCDASEWTEFRFVNALEFRQMNCTTAGCKEGMEVFRPRENESVFFWPTDNTRLFKRGPDLMQIVKINGKFLNRCER